MLHAIRRHILARAYVLAHRLMPEGTMLLVLPISTADKIRLRGDCIFNLDEEELELIASQVRLELSLQKGTGS